MAADLLSRVAARLAGADRLTTRPGPAGELMIVGPDPRWPVIVVEHRRGDEHAAVFLARICDERCAEPTRILMLAGQMGAGALALVGGAYVARFTVPATQIESVALDAVVLYLRDLARELAGQIANDPTSATFADTFAHLAT